MLKYYFPLCPVKGSLEPVPFEHMGLKGAIPRKCMLCPNLFEGECLRDGRGFKALDYGPCSEGKVSSYLVEVEKRYEGKRRIFKLPDKCKGCKYLRWDEVHLFYCNAESNIWGDFPKRLDFSGIKTENIRPLKPLLLKIISGKGYGKNAFKEAFEDVLSNPSLPLKSKGVLMVIEGDGNIITLSDLDECLSKFQNILSNECELSYRLFTPPEMINKVFIHISLPTE